MKIQLALFFKGIAMGAADIVPGVSGGTIALITGQDIDSGTSSEIGFTYANKRPVIAINAEERRYRNLFVEGMINKTVSNIDELLEAIKSLEVK